MEVERDVRRERRHGLLCLLSSVVAVVATTASGHRALDVALWAVLAPLVTGAALVLVTRSRRPAPVVRVGRSAVVLPDPVRTPHDF